MSFRRVMHQTYLLQNPELYVSHRGHHRRELLKELGNFEYGSVGRRERAFYFLMTLSPSFEEVAFMDSAVGRRAVWTLTFWRQVSIISECH